MSQPKPNAENAFLLSEIVVNEAEHLSAIVIRPGLNQNGFSYCDANIKGFAAVLPSIPLVKDHGEKVEDNIGKWLKPEILSDGSLKGAFQISASEDKILAKVKDGTIRYTSSMHTYGDRSFCTVCNTTLPPRILCKSHHIGKIYDGKVAGIGFENPRLLHVSLVQTPADMGCAILNSLGSFLADRIDSGIIEFTEAAAKHTSEVAELRQAQATVANELKAAKDELDKYRRLRFAEPPAKIAVSPPPQADHPEKGKVIIRSWLGQEER